MDKETLVENDFEVEGAVVSALSRTQIPVTAVDWKWASELGEWQLIVVTRLHDKEGPNAAYRQILDALSKAGWYNTFPIRRLFVKSPHDPVAQALVQELKHNVEGSVHINRGVNEPYAIVFAPYLGTGGAIPSIHTGSERELREFLTKKLEIPAYKIDLALGRLRDNGNATILEVRQPMRKLRHLGLIP
jgi:hypothetical protein